MTLSYSETRITIDLVLRTSSVNARDQLHHHMVAIRRQEPEFYMGVIEHGPYMSYSSEEWFDFFSKIRARIFRNDWKLMSKLSENQRQMLPEAEF